MGLRKLFAIRLVTNPLGMPAGGLSEGLGAIHGDMEDLGSMLPDGRGVPGVGHWTDRPGNGGFYLERFHHLAQDGRAGAEHDHKVSDDGLMAQILDVQSHHAAAGGLVFTVDLPTARDAGQAVEPFPVGGSILISFRRSAGPGPDNAHFPLQHIDQLGKLVEPGGPQIFPPPDQAGVIMIEFGHGPSVGDQLLEILMMDVRVRPFAHAAEFINREGLAAVSDPLLRIESPAFGNQIDPNPAEKSGRHPDRRGHQNDGPIQTAFP